MKKASFLLFFALILTTCSKNDENAPSEVFFRPETSDIEALSPEEVAILDNLPRATGFSPRTVLLPNGEILENYLKDLDVAFYNKWLRNDPYENLGPQAARNLLIKHLTGIALRLTDREKMFSINGQKNGIAYSWGSKTHKIRQSPPGEGTVCRDPIYGLDCSGFIHQLFLEENIKLPVGPADNQRNPNILQKAIQLAIPALDKVKVDDLGTIPTNKFETGDIIYWLNGGRAQHIGIVLKDLNGRLAVFASNGRQGTNEEECQKNLGPSRGPTRIALNNQYWFGPNKLYGVTRINADISGKWEFKFRCEGSNNPDFFVHELKFPTTNSSTFSITKEFTDLDGSNDKTVFEFNYDKVSNILSCTYITTTKSDPSFKRKDSFAVKLEKDIIDYFPAKKEYVSGGVVCVNEIRLKNLN